MSIETIQGSCNLSLGPSGGAVGQSGAPNPTRPPVFGTALRLLVTEERVVERHGAVVTASLQGRLGGRFMLFVSLLQQSRSVYTAGEGLSCASDAFHIFVFLLLFFSLSFFFQMSANKHAAHEKVQDTRVWDYILKTHLKRTLTFTGELDFVVSTLKEHAPSCCTCCCCCCCVTCCYKR